MTADGGTVSIRDVAAAAGVSVATVSNVLNSTGRFSEKTKHRVEEAIRELGFVRNRSAFELRTKEKAIIGLLVPNLANSFFASMARGVIDRAAEHGLLVVVADSLENEDHETATLLSLTEQQVEDIVLLPVQSAKAILERWSPAKGARVVFVDAEAPDSYCSVAADDSAGGQLVLEHLISVGATRVGYIAPDDYGVTRARYRGAKRAADAAGISLEWVPIQAMDVAAGVEVGQRLVRSGLPFDGLATANDLVGIGLLRALREAKVPVPGEVAVVGYDDLDRSQDLPIPLTSVRQPKEELGALALEMLISERSREPHRHSSRVLLPELAPRASTAPLRVGRS